MVSLSPSPHSTFMYTHDYVQNDNWMYFSASRNNIKAFVGIFLCNATKKWIIDDAFSTKLFLFVHYHYYFLLFIRLSVSEVGWRERLKAKWLSQTVWSQDKNETLFNGSVELSLIITISVIHITKRKEKCDQLFSCMREHKNKQSKDQYLFHSSMKPRKKSWIVWLKNRYGTACDRLNKIRIKMWEHNVGWIGEWEKKDENKMKIRKTSII